jgi:hypothetical protein
MAALAISLGSVSAMANAGEIYLKGGFLGVGAGYAHGVNERFTLRGDVTTIGNYSKNGTSSDFDYKGRLKNDTANLYGDWFPFANGFRLTAGLNVRDTRITAKARPNSSGEITIGDTTITFDGGDTADAKVKYPDVTPYIGIGWGHNVAQRKSGSWGFVADAGVSIGKPKVSFDVSNSVRAKLGADASAEIDKQRDEIKDKLGKYNVFPTVYVGVSYVF